MPEQPPPLQPVNVAVADGMAVNVTTVPAPKELQQVAPQLMPAGELVTVPGPWPDRSAASTNDDDEDGDEDGDGDGDGDGDEVEVLGPKLALTDVAAFNATVQVPVPEQPPPLQPVNVAVADGMAVNVTTVPAPKEVEQIAPQLMPAGELVTVPKPWPDRCAVSTKDRDGDGDGDEVEVLGPKLALTDVAAFSATVQVPVPEQPPPLQPVNMAVADGVAVNVTTVPAPKALAQVAPQLIPAGELVTVPEPWPDRSAVSTNDEVEVFRAKLAMTILAAFIATVQVPLPEHPSPLHPVNVAVADGVAVSVTVAPLVNEAEQVVPHEIPAWVLVTVPVPVPARDTVSVSVEGVVVDTPVLDTSRESVSPFAVKLTLALAAVVFVGAKRTVTVWVAPAPTRVNGLPETMLNGAATDAVPVTVPVRAFWTVKVCVAELPIGRLPKLTVVVGVTVKPTCATALAAGEHALSIPVVSTAVTDTLYRVPLLRPVSRNVTRWLDDGAVVDDAT